MAKTYRKLPERIRCGYHRKPKYKHKLLAGESAKRIVTDWDDKPIAARREVWGVV